MHLSKLQDARRRIDQRRFGRHADEVRRRQEYEQEYDNSDSALEPIAAGNAADNATDNPEGPLLSPGRSEHSSGPVVSKSPESSPMKEE